MTTLTIQQTFDLDPEDLGASGSLLSGLTDLWRSISGHLHRALESPEQRAVRLAVEGIGCVIASASSLDDLDARLEECLSSGQLADVRHLVLQASVRKPSELPAETSRAFADALLDVAGPAEGRRLERLSSLFVELARVTAVIARVAGSDPAVGASLAAWPRADLLLRSPEVPPVVAVALYHSLRLDLCVLALVAILVNKRPRRRWLAPALLARSEDSALAMLRFLGGLPGIAVSETWVPANARIDVQAEVEAFLRGRAVAHKQWEGANAALVKASAEGL